MRNYDEFDDYEGEGGFEKFTNRKGSKKKYKGHQSRHGKDDLWAQAMQEDESYATMHSTPKVTPHYTKNAQPQRNFVPPINHMVVEEGPNKVPYPNSNKPYVKHEHVFGPNTHTIKGVKIDMDGVKGIERFERPYEGKTSYGIKFIFKGFKESYRIIWFKNNELERDRVYANELSFWTKLQNKQ